MFLKNGDKEDDIMHAKTMEGLIGARTNMELLNTPFRVYKEARLKGDTAKMEQAMGYMSDFCEEAYEYKKKADEGMKKDAEETRKIAEEQREEAVWKRKEEREKVLLKDNIDPDNTGSGEIKTNAVKEPVTYTKTGEEVSMEQYERGYRPALLDAAGQAGSSWEIGKPVLSGALDIQI